MTNPATLVLADGTTFSGISIGKEGSTVGNVVFNTAMIGYQELLTDPASKDQLIAFSYPHIGNTGINQEDRGSDHVQAAGLIIRDLPLFTSNFRSEEKLESYLIRHGLVAIAGIDTRRLTRHLRTFGSQAGCIVTGENLDITAATTKAQAWQISEVDALTSDHKGYDWSEGKWQLGRGFHQGISEKPLHVVVMDFGVTKDILRHFAESGCHVTVVPRSTMASEILALHPSGLFLSNGSGDPSAYQTVITEIASLIKSEIPLFAVGLGHQLLGIALGGKVTKLPHGHHSVNHPVQEIFSGKVMMTSQNHHYVLLEESLPETVLVTHHSLIDHSVQGIRLPNQCVYSFQGYPEGDAAFLFDQLIDAMWTK
ncbi:glutamine-hydrolyzing carbamoyl-phosphate synthase small subunit [Ignatzschineria rhizosphaerae]|uniref:Carbamoyl phosphate synthase small chain n=1 Tax=Ignatzschineria rhizosphaerae TaxID=2923279 RepID=A0ABY3X0F7_9GAMM|nr:glutamine-hydrolyzing carbamoyl-phosphate synthase small subunit [Ignatzschineria rhizosphaerae]UNM95350.1 glutamine-hydrolyzing carbamoyl-phosphate synthase small subunit [Ignatzschineria rhizosphaerae]